MLRFMVLTMVVLLVFARGGEPGDKHPAPPTAGAVDQPAPSAPSSLPLNWDFNKDESGRALGGYDAVAYFTDGEAKPGSDEFRYEWGDAVWLFSVAENRDKFAASPENFLPANGGYCTFGIVLKKKLDGNPQVWHMEESRLYLFLNAEVKGKFMLDQSGNMKTVSENWPSIKGKDL